MLQLAATWLDGSSLHSFACTCKSAGHCYAGGSEPADHASSLRQKLKTAMEGDATAHRFVMTSGTGMMSQFRPRYFGVAFAFLFKFCTGMPDMPTWSKHPRHRRAADAPRIEFPLWVRIMSRRVEQQLKRDWLLGFTMSSVLFHSLINQRRTVYSYDKVRRKDGSRGFSAAELEAGAISICSALDGKYKDLNGTWKKVNGDFTKVKYASNLNEAG